MKLPVSHRNTEYFSSSGDPDPNSIPAAADQTPATAPQPWPRLPTRPRPSSRFPPARARPPPRPAPPPPPPARGCWLPRWAGLAGAGLQSLLSPVLLAPSLGLLTLPGKSHQASSSQNSSIIPGSFLLLPVWTTASVPGSCVGVATEIKEKKREERKVWRRETGEER